MIMATIDRSQLLADVLEELPPSNTMSDAMILKRAEIVISRVGDDDKYYGQVACETTKAVAKWNMAQETQMTNTKRKKTYEEETEWFDGQNPTDQWQDFIDNLPCLCADAWNYNGLRSRFSSGFRVTVGTPVRYPRGAPEYGGKEDSIDDC